MQMEQVKMRLTNDGEYSESNLPVFFYWFMFNNIIIKKS